MALVVKNPLPMQAGMRLPVRFLSREDPLEEGMATHSSILVWRIPWTEEPGRLRSIESQRVRHDLLTAAAAMSLQSCPPPCDPIDGSPPGSAILGILQATPVKPFIMILP